MYTPRINSPLMSFHITQQGWDPGSGISIIIISPNITICSFDPLTSHCTSEKKCPAIEQILHRAKQRETQLALYFGSRGQCLLIFFFFLKLFFNFPKGKFVDYPQIWNDPGHCIICCWLQVKINPLTFTFIISLCIIREGKISLYGSLH